ncbi:TetR/AcrR family transcriptional regulator [Telmatospirillum sp. J64-1]|uniref:TetR/AcrR family transcriptional regulator n=1 Tax=Telmatospirillum sp. J64-1 TaxID=2502183 RepID=UPI00115D2781|nr:TetR/AcrR family transcriptional regulator [Telmatospirillum sp. J64-1]
MIDKEQKKAPILGQRGRARCRALLDAAAKLFAEKGFEKTTLKEILDQAGGSRTTLYEQFGDKEGLFRAMMEEHCCHLQSQLTEVLPNETEDPEEGLIRFGQHFVQTLTRPSSAAIVRRLVSEGGRIPDIAENFLNIGPRKTEKRLSSYLKHMTEAGKLAIEDPDKAAKGLAGMMVCNLLVQRLIIPDQPVDRECVNAHIRYVVRLFLTGARARREGVA